MKDQVREELRKNRFRRVAYTYDHMYCEVDGLNRITAELREFDLTVKLDDIYLVSCRYEDFNMNHLVRFIGAFRKLLQQVK